MLFVIILGGGSATFYICFSLACDASEQLRTAKPGSLKYSLCWLAIIIPMIAWPMFFGWFASTAIGLPIMSK